VMGVYLSRICYLWWLSVDVESDTKKIWKAVSQLQFVAWIVVLLIAVNALDYMQINHLFNDSDLSRFRFLAVILLLYHAFSHLFLSLWGHFYFQKKKEPSHLPVHYSSANWILRFRMSYYLQKLLKACIAEQIPKHSESQAQFAELRQINPGLSQFSLGDVLGREMGFLKEANLRLTKI
jgi:hypothetical protein